ncbi:MAG: hypothetical protein OEV64_12010 [Desulfobulbaceae bacterium]|nr:hypothetical protein [Desulfobulbaceae bacterium]
MTIPTKSIMFSAILLLIGALFILGGCAQTGPRGITLAGGEQAIVTKGIVDKVILRKNTLILKQFKGAKITLHLDDNVVYRVISSSRNIIEGMSLEVIYRADGEHNRVIELKKLPDLGCGTA